ncbi:MAG: DUF4097 family beta strand repeat protein [Acidobacteria bacterium]|nr:DUF4097 family beta strand repeat protein [Acidobacteriota bacterium]
MSEPTRRGSLIGGAIVVVLGVLFLLRNLGYSVPWWSWFRQYWPALLILLGIGKVIQYLRGGPRARISFGEIVAVLLILLLGLAAGASSFSGLHWSWHDWSVRIGDRPFSGPSYTFTEEQTRVFSPGSILKVENRYGRVDVLPGEGEGLTVQLKKYVYTQREEDARKIAGAIHLAFEESKGGVGMKTSEPDLEDKDIRFTTDISVLAPRQASLEVVNRYGPITVKGFQGAHRLENKYGSVEASDLEGEVTIENKYESVQARRIQGSLKIVTKYGPVRVEKVSQDVWVESGYSPITVTDTGGTVQVLSKYSSVVVERAGKSVSVEAPGSEVRVESVKGDARVSSGYKTIRIRDVEGSTDLDSKYGQVQLESVTGPVKIRSRHDKITLSHLISDLRIEAEHSSVSGQALRSASEIRTSYSGVSLGGSPGPVSVLNHHGNVQLTLEAPPKQDISVKNRYGDVQLALPDDSQFSIDGQAESGHIRSDFEGFEVKILASKDSVISGQIGKSGPKITVETSFGTIALKKQVRKSI